MKNSKTTYKLIKNGKLFQNGKLLRKDLLIKNNKIFKIKDTIADNPAYEIIDASDSIVSYGFIDPHVHFRTPGSEDKEDWVNGSNAAINGGFTYVIDMPNTKPITDNYDVLQLKNRIAADTKINFGFHIGLTANNLDKIGQIKRVCKKNNIPLHGIKVFLGSSTGDLLITDEKLITITFKYNLPLLFHCEDEETLKSIPQKKFKTISDHNANRPPEAELKSVQKVIKLSQHHKTPVLYFCHISTELALEYLKENKTSKIRVEATPHHLRYSIQNLKNIADPAYKVNPPIREESDRLALIKAFNNDVADAVGSDHAPHLRMEKESENPPSGMPGIESVFYVLNELADRNEIDFLKILKKLTSSYKIFNIKKRGIIKKGYFADLTIIRNREYIHNPKHLKNDVNTYKNIKSSKYIKTVIISGKIILNILDT